MELDHDPECLLLHQLQQVRLHELRAGIPVELQSSEARIFELDGVFCGCELDHDVRYELPSPTCLEKESGVATTNPTREACESSEGGQTEEDSRKELPSWSWGVLREEKKEMEMYPKEDTRGETTNDTNKSDADSI